MLLEYIRSYVLYLITTVKLRDKRAVLKNIWHREYRVFRGRGGHCVVVSRFQKSSPGKYIAISSSNCDGYSELPSSSSLSSSLSFNTPSAGLLAVPSARGLTVVASAVEACHADGSPEKSGRPLCPTSDFDLFDLGGEDGADSTGWRLNGRSKSDAC